MRRIIERVVTVVTTTTWTISWQGDTDQADPQPFDPPFGRQDKPVPVTDDSPKPDVSDETTKHIQKFSSVIATKEADPAETKTDSTADEPLLDPNSNQSKIKRN